MLEHERNILFNKVWSLAWFAANCWAVAAAAAAAHGNPDAQKNENKIFTRIYIYMCSTRCVAISRWKLSCCLPECAKLVLNPKLSEKAQFRIRKKFSSFRTRFQQIEAGKRFRLATWRVHFFTRVQIGAFVFAFQFESQGTQTLPFS